MVLPGNAQSDKFGIKVQPEYDILSSGDDSDCISFGDMCNFKMVDKSTICDIFILARLSRINLA